MLTLWQRIIGNIVFVGRNLVRVNLCSWLTPLLPYGSDWQMAISDWF